jgi:hypothetical protein
MRLWRKASTSIALEDEVLILNGAGATRMEIASRMQDAPFDKLRVRKEGPVARAIHDGMLSRSTQGSRGQP